MFAETEYASPPGPFNSSLESAMRIIFLLEEFYPRTMDMEQLVIFDYLIVHTGDINGPVSLHPAAPGRGKEFLIRRPIVEGGIRLLISKGLVEQNITENGFFYRASDLSLPVTQSLSSAYILQIKERASWIAKEYANLSHTQLSDIIKNIVDIKSFEFYTSGEHLEGTTNV